MTDQPRTQRVHILVAIDGKGNWASGGYGLNGESHDPHEWIAIDDLDTLLSYHWIEADVPIPQETTIADVATPDARGNDG